VADLDSLQAALGLQAQEQTINMLKWVMITGGGGMVGAIAFLTRQVLDCKEQRVRDVQIMMEKIEELLGKS
jgi:FlaA1/EpsC-like NDP-sugar epimerase